MKICQTCFAIYDDSMFFCLEDGSVLNGYQKFQPTNNETETLIKPIVPETVFIPAVQSETAMSDETISFSLEPSDKRNTNLLLIILMLLGLSGAAIGSYFLFSGSGELEAAAININTSKNAAANYEAIAPNFPDKNLFPNTNLNVNRNAANTKAKPTPATNENRQLNRNIRESDDNMPVQRPSPVPKPPVETPDTISGGIVNSKAIRLIKPVYPAAARDVRASGEVIVLVLIDENGNVISASATSGHSLLRDAAVSAARQSKFSPTVVSGQKVKVRGNIAYNFAH
jgi:TonB family protein